MDGVADLVVVALLGALVLLLAGSFLLTRSRVRDVLAEARRQADRVRADAEQEAARRIGAARAERDRLLAEAAEHRAALERREQRITVRERRFDGEVRRLDEARRRLDERAALLDRREAELSRLAEERRAVLERTAALSA